MLDCEYVIRFFAFTQLNYEKDYNNNIDTYLIKTMKFINNCSELALNEMKEEFCAVMETSYDIFGKYTFRKFFDGGRRGPVNKAIFEIWSYCLSKLSMEKRKVLVKMKNTVIKRFEELLKQDEFSGWIKSGKKGAIRQRIDKTMEMVVELLYDDETGNKEF